MIKLVIFDLDGVLYRYDKEWRIAQFAERSGRTVEEVRRIWLESGWEDEAERGRFATGPEYLAAFNGLLGTDFSLEEWVDNRRRAMTPDDEVLAIAVQAKMHARIAVLTNNGPLLREQIASVAPRLPPLFGDNFHVSAEFRARKPEAEIFNAVMHRHEVRPGETAYTDDSQTNVSAAQALGIAAHHFRSAEGLKGFVNGLWAGPGPG